MSREPLSALLRESLALLNSWVPKALRGLCGPLQGRTVLLDVDDERVEVRFAARNAEVRDTPGDIVPPPLARIRTSRRTILDVLDARTTVHDAVLAGDLEALADLDDLVTLNQALAAYLHGAVRSPGFPELVERFRGGPAPEPSP